LILDNVSGIQQVNPLIPPSSWLLIVTSTKPVLISRMVTIALEPMEILEAHTLLTRWAPEISPSIKEISLICQCIPLALEIIGKLFAINSTMAPDYFAKKFKEAWESIGGKEEKSNLIDGVRAALTLSYRMLPEKTAQVLRKLYVFPESFTANAVSFICEDPKSLSLTGLEKFGLVQHNVNTNRFSLHPQVRKFIKPLLKPVDRGMTEKRLATEFMNVLETAYHHVEKGGKDAIKGFRLFDLELENIKAGMEWSRKHCDKDKDAARVCSAYTENGTTMIGQRLSPAECIQWFEAALSSAKLLEDKESERKHLLNLGQQYVLLNRSQEAMDTLQCALSFCKKEGNIEGQRAALQQLVLTCLKNNNCNSATDYMEEDLELVRTSGDKEEEFKLLAQLTKFCIQNKEYNKAIHTGEQGMDLAHLNENKPLQITLLHNLGRGYTETGEAKKALETFEKGLALSQKTPKAPLQGELIKQISDAAFKTGNIPAALKYLVQGLEVVRKTNDPPTEGSLLIQLAEVHIHNQSEDQAMKYLEEALRACPIKSKTARWKERHCGYGARLCGKKGIWMKRLAGDRKL
jgi:tetratricopeptide (TPR) repeat protein